MAFSEGTADAREDLSSEGVVTLCVKRQYKVGLVSRRVRSAVMPAVTGGDGLADLCSAAASSAGVTRRVKGGWAFATLVMLCRERASMLHRPRSCHALSDSAASTVFPMLLSDNNTARVSRFAPSLGQLPHAAGGRDTNRCRRPLPRAETWSGQSRASRGRLWNARVRVDVSEGPLLECSPLSCCEKPCRNERPESP